VVLNLTPSGEVVIYRYCISLVYLNCLASHKYDIGKECRRKGGLKKKKKRKKSKGREGWLVSLLVGSGVWVRTLTGHVG